MRATGLKYSLTDHIVTIHCEVWHGDTQQTGVDRLIGWDIVEMHGDKSAPTRRPLWERTDPQTAWFAERQRAQQASW